LTKSIFDIYYIRYVHMYMPYILLEVYIYIEECIKVIHSWSFL